MVDFTSLLDKPVDEIERPKPIPAGTYKAVVVRHEFGESNRKQTPYCRYYFRPFEPMDDIDTDQFEEFGGMEKLQNKELREDFWLTDEAMFRLRSFLENAIGLKGEGRSLGEVIPEADSQEVLISVTHRTSDDGEQVFANISNFASVEE